MIKNKTILYLILIVLIITTVSVFYIQQNNKEYQERLNNPDGYFSKEF